MSYCTVCGGKCKQDGTCPACQAKEGKKKQSKKRIILIAVIAAAVIAAIVGAVLLLNDDTGDRRTSSSKHHREESTYDESGTCGASLNWGFNEETGELTIFGEGYMDDYAVADESHSTAPWGQLPIRSVNMEGGSSIGEFAFIYCFDLEEVQIADTVESIGMFAFMNCALTEVHIPASVTEIGASAFSAAYDLTQIYVDEENEAYMDMDGVLFTKDAQTLVCYPIARTQESYTVPEGVTTIDRYAFADCDGLTQITLPEGLERIELGAFGGCENLDYVSYNGTESQWNDIVIGSDNEELTEAYIQFADEESELDHLPQADSSADTPILLGEDIIIYPDGSAHDPLSSLKYIWYLYAEGEKFPVIGGNVEANIMDRPGIWDPAYKDGLTTTLLIPADQLESVSEAATMIHMMNTNTFTSGVVELAEGTDTAAFAKAVRDAIQGNQWLCGFPEKLIISDLGNGNILIAYGINDAMSVFEAHLSEAFSNANTLYSEAISG